MNITGILIAAVIVAVIGLILDFSLALQAKNLK